MSDALNIVREKNKDKVNDVSYIFLYNSNNSNK